jgi:hypothetical protein
VLGATLDAGFSYPNLTTFARADRLGLEVTGQHVMPDRATLACRIVEPDQWRRRCGCEGTPRDTVTRRLAHEPLGWRPTTLVITIRRYRCTGCGHVWRQDTSHAADPASQVVPPRPAMGTGSHRVPPPVPVCRELKDQMLALHANDP